ncbi:MAG: hypothetical protein ABTD50_19670 [Polyangiaceae bacterium]
MKISSLARRATTDIAPLFVALVGLRCSGAMPPVRDPGLTAVEQTAAAPVTFAFDSLDERIVNAAATRGKPTVLAFVTTDSLAAQAQVDFLVAMAKRDATAVNYVIVAIGAQDTRELVDLYRRALHVPFPVALADSTTSTGAGPFGDVRAVPVTVVLDREGRIVWRSDGRVAKSPELRAAMVGL